MKKILLIVLFITILTLFNIFCPVNWGWKIIVSIVYLFTVLIIAIDRRS